MLAPKKFLAIALIAISEVDASAVCAYPSGPSDPAATYRNWFVNLARIAQETSASATAVTGATLGGQLTAIAAEGTLITANTGACQTALVTLINEMKANLAYQKTLSTSTFNCPTAGTWVDADHAPLWWGYKCTRLMTALTGSFNTVANNGYDIVTGKANQRCTVAQYTDIESKYQPYNAMVTLAASRAAISPVLDFATWPKSIPTLVGSVSFADALAALVPPTNTASGGNCKNCFNTFYSAVWTVFNSDATKKALCSTSTLASSDDCKVTLAAQISDFHQCNGEHYMHYKMVTDADRCSAENWALLDGVYRGYVPVGKCSDKTSDYDIQSCLATRTGLPVGTVVGGESCLTCWPSLASDIKASSTTIAAACLADPTAVGCISNIDGAYVKTPSTDPAVDTAAEAAATTAACVADANSVACLSGSSTVVRLNELAKAQMKSPLTEFNVCSGYKMNTASTACSSDDIAKIKAKNLSGANLLSAALTSAMATGATPDTVIASLLSVIPSDLASVNCITSFKAMALDIYKYRSMLGSVCAGTKVTDSACTSLLSTLHIFDAFKAGTGATDLMAIPSDTTPPVTEVPVDGTSTNSAGSTSIATGLILVVLAANVVN